MNKNKICISGRNIGDGFSPYIIAELSANHNGDIERAFAIMEHAKKSGADAIKIQSYSADTITIDCDRPEFKIVGGPWGGKTLYELYRWAEMPWDWHKPLFDKARELGITIFSSPFDFSSVDLLESLGAPAYKIASFECVDLPLIRRVAQTGKPMIISTGMANMNEIQEAVETARNSGCKELALLHCVSGYPALAEEYNLRTIQDMKQRFNVVVGLSDHTLDNTTAISSVAMGASIIEKHVTLDRSAGGPDDSFSLEPKELKELVSGANTAWSALGEVNYDRTESEKQNVIFRRSLYAVKDIKEGETLTPDVVKSIRPGYGLAPKHYDEVLGKSAKCNISRGTPLDWTIVG